MLGVAPRGDGAALGFVPQTRPDSPSWSHTPGRVPA